jgi:hypothetical protein
MDVASRRERDNDIERFASWPRVLMFKTMSLMYVGLAAISLVVWAMLGLR